MVTVLLKLQVEVTSQSDFFLLLRFIDLLLTDKERNVAIYNAAGQQLQFNLEIF